MYADICKNLIGKLALFLVLVSIGSKAEASFQICLGGVQKTDPNSPTIADNTIVLTFDQNGADVVRLTIDANVDAIKVDDIVFNVDRAVTFAFVSGVNPGNGFEYDSDNEGVNGGSPALVGFDILVNYKVSGPNGEFFNGQQTVVDISASGLTEQSFNVLAANGYLGAVHINKPQGGTISGKYANTTKAPPPVPEPGTIAVWSVLGLVAVCVAGRRRRNNASAAHSTDN